MLRSILLSLCCVHSGIVSENLLKALCRKMTCLSPEPRVGILVKWLGSENHVLTVNKISRYLMEVAYGDQVRLLPPVVNSETIRVNYVFGMPYLTNISI